MELRVQERKKDVDRGVPENVEELFFFQKILEKTLKMDSGVVGTGSSCRGSGIDRVEGTSN